MLDYDGNGPPSPQKRYRAKHGKHSKGNIAGQRKRGRARKSATRRRCIAILDLETNPFNSDSEAYITPFLAVLYSDQFEPIIMWNENWTELVSEIIVAIEALPDSFTIYAHNGGRFDYMFLIHEIRGSVMFKGRSLMRAKVGEHELRDSLHIIPESLKNASNKNDIDYRWFAPDQRAAHRDEIIAYCLSDCEYTFDVVRAFVDRFGLPMTIGQCAMKELKKHYAFEHLSERSDAYLRDYFFGGRTECLASAGVYSGAFKLYDVHSMYPSVMAFQHHPIGAGFLVSDKLTPRTAFVHLTCTNKRGAFLVRSDDDSLVSTRERGEFKVTIHEFNTALKLDLISDVEIIRTLDFDVWSDFSKFVIPLYNERMRLKEILVAMEAANQKASPEYKRTKQDATFLKYLLNNCYGKFAQNPRRFKEYYLTDPNAEPPIEWQYYGVDWEYHHSRKLDPSITLEQVKNWRTLPEVENERYWIWSHANPEFRFNNVATAASITGAARAKLMEAIASAVDPLYCDTDSLICAGVNGLDVTDSQLGTWHLEQHISEVVIAGKKLYGYIPVTPSSSGPVNGKPVVRCKGVKSFNSDKPYLGGVTYDDIVAIAGGKTLAVTLSAPTISKNQQQKYIKRELRRTAASPQASFVG